MENSLSSLFCRSKSSRQLQAVPLKLPCILLAAAYSYWLNTPWWSHITAAVCSWVQQQTLDCKSYNFKQFVTSEFIFLKWNTHPCSLVRGKLSFKRNCPLAESFIVLRHNATYHRWYMFWAHTWIAQASQSADRKPINHPALSHVTFFPFPPTPLLLSFFQAGEKLSPRIYCEFLQAGCALALEQVVYSKIRLLLIKAIHFSHLQCFSNATAHHSILDTKSLTPISLTNFFHFSYRYFLSSTSKEGKIIYSCLPSSEDVSDHHIESLAAHHFTSVLQ